MSSKTDRRHYNKNGVCRLWVRQKIPSPNPRPSPNPACLPTEAFLSAIALATAEAKEGHCEESHQRRDDEAI